MKRLFLERGKELAAIEAASADACRGEGRLVVVHGPAGIGKSTLLGEARVVADGRMVTLAARGSEMEREFPFGVVRQLFLGPARALLSQAGGGLLDGAAELAAPVLGLRSGRALPAIEPNEAALLGVHWLMADMAAGRPLLVVIDDLHLADEASLRWVGFAARRLEGVPAAIVVAYRSDEREAHRISGLLGEAIAMVLEPEPLSQRAVADLLTDDLGQEPGEGFAKAAAHVTGGNPLLIRELTQALAREGIAPTVENVDRVTLVASGSLSDRIQRRVGRLGEAAVALARAAAVLTPDAPLAGAATLADLTLASAAAAADALRSASVLSPGPSLEYAHPLVRQAIYNAIPPSERALMHLRAARILSADRATTERVTAHLLLGEPAGDPWVVEALRLAATEALERGVPNLAIDLLRRALAEGAPLMRLDILIQLGTAELRLRDPAASGHLNEAMRLTQEPIRRGEIALSLSRALIMSGDSTHLTAVDAILPSVRQADPELAKRIEVQWLATAHLDPASATILGPRVDGLSEPAGDSPGDRALLAVLAAETLVQAGRAERAVDLAERALAGGRLLEEQDFDSPVVYLAIFALIHAGSARAAREHVESALGHARRRGSLTGVAHALTWRAELAYREGNLREAEADSVAALETGDRAAYSITNPLARAWLTLARLELVGAQAASEALGPFRAMELPLLGPMAPLMMARGLVARANHDPARACADFLRAGDALLASRVPGPVLSWRSAASGAHLALGDIARSRALAEEELQLARGTGAPRDSGIALRALAAADTERRIPLLREAVLALERSEDRLEHARALCDLGAAVRRTGQRAAAREPLRTALDLAHRCGANVLVERVHQEMLASGARPRRLALSGRDSLTPAELRVAELAAKGLSNKEIAQSLFVTVKTVETQLGHVYGKLDVASRRHIERALASA